MPLYFCYKSLFIQNNLKTSVSVDWKYIDLHYNNVVLWGQIDMVLVKQFAALNIEVVTVWARNFYVKMYVLVVKMQIHHPDGSFSKLHLIKDKGLLLTFLRSSIYFGYIMNYAYFTF